MGVVVPHTHWDRAWYQPFEAYRVRLVRTVDALLDLMDHAPEFRNFTLDGQVALLDDYLEIRPENRSRLRNLISVGRIEIGPWYTLPDLFLAGGEAVIRNLQWGRSLSREWGVPMPVGYVPDSFGHFAQLPQILRGFGLDSFIFMRGLSAEMKSQLGSVFDWRAPDGSTVLAVNQSLGYFAASALGHASEWGRYDQATPDLELALKRVEDALAKLSSRQRERTVLLPNGCDHMPAQAELPKILAFINARLPNARLEMGTYSDFVERLRSEKATHGMYEGDLLGNVDHPILSSVYSTRVYLKEQNHRALSHLLRYAEPLSVWRGLDEPFLRQAWKALLLNHAHDDICGCSVDAVHRENEVRFDRSAQISATLITEHLEALVSKGFVPLPSTGTGLHGDVWIFNPHPFGRDCEIETSVLFANPGGEFAAPTPERRLRARDARGSELGVETLSTRAPDLRSAFLETSWGRSYRIRLRVFLPPLGYEVFRVYESDDPVSSSAAPPQGTSIENSLYSVSIETGGVSVLDKSSGRSQKNSLVFEHQSDSGDTYTFGPVQGEVVRKAVLIDARRTDAHGLELRHELEFADRTKLSLTTALRFSADGGINLQVRYRNDQTNGRLRVRFDMGFRPNHVWADSPFRLAPHLPPGPANDGPQVPAYPGERSYPTRYAGDYVLLENDRGQSAWVATRGLHEYECDSSWIAITLHRAVGALSVNGGAIRACHAGPAVATPEAQCLREMEHHLQFGFAPRPRDVGVRAALAFAHPPWAQELPRLPCSDRAGIVPRRATLLELSNPNVVLSALRPSPESGTFALRVYNQSAARERFSARFGIPVARWCRSDLNETWNENAVARIIDDTIETEIGPAEILTLLVGT